MGWLEQQQRIVDQSMAFLGLLGAAVFTGALALALTRRRRFPHALAWGLFLLHVLVVASVPALRALDQASVGVYSLRGVTIGLIGASMLSLTYRRTPAEG